MFTSNKRPISFSHFSPAATRSLRIVSRCIPVSRSVLRTLAPSRSIPSAMRASLTGVVILPKGFGCSSVKVRLQSGQRKRRLPLRFTAKRLHVPWQAGQGIVGLGSIACSMVILYESRFGTASGKGRNNRIILGLTSRAAFVYNRGMSKTRLPPDMRAYLAKIGRKGGLKGGRARMDTMTPEQRSESARRAVQARWARVKETGL